LGSEAVRRRRPWGARRVLGIAGVLVAVAVVATGARALVGVATLADDHAHSSYPLPGARLVIEGAGSTNDGRVSTGLPTDPGSPMRITASSDSGDVVVRRAG
jgi:hypothetical protein